MPLTETNLRRRLKSFRPRELDKTAATPQAAVATILSYALGDPRVLLIRRTENERDPWSGHMAFPGGRQDETDPDLVHTAKRETMEEVHVDLDLGEHLGRLDDVRGVSRARTLDLVIVPQVFVLPELVAPIPEKGEVADALWVPLGPMLRGETMTTVRYERDGHVFELPGFRVGDHVVWGLTHRMLESLFEVLRGT
ncbi:MAG: CoA pyrophosphatase [Myxococcales bacterium]|nr:CoA pyrophosphatase [Myxococcales bacterium]